MFTNAETNVDMFSWSKTYDILMRLPILIWSCSLAIFSIASLEMYVRQGTSRDTGALYSINIAARVSVIIYLVILAGTALARAPAMARTRGIEPRISAIIGSFLITVVLLFPRTHLSTIEAVVSMLLVVVGNVLAIFVLVRLRHSFSIMPEARQLVVSGPYRLVRHPLYLAEEVVAVGGLLQFLSIWTLGILVVQIIFQVRRIQNEEAMLISIFAEYTNYKAVTPCLVPGVIRNT